METLIGKVLGNRYEIVEKVGEGGMAIVYKARCLLLDRFVAVKVLKTEFIADDEFLDKFEKESQSAAKLSNHNIVKIYDVGIDGDYRYIVMELIVGSDLKSYIKNKKDPISQKELILIAKQVANALEHAHDNNIVHRDIKPHNIMISKSGEIKVTDFGIAHAVSSSTIVNHKDMMGSVHYTSPEQARGGFCDEKSDIYSLGILMYELATGQLPFDGDKMITVALKHLKENVIPPSKHNPNLSEGLENIILKAIQKEPSKRYLNASNLIHDLDQVLEDPESTIELVEDDLYASTRKLPNLDEYEKDEVKFMNKKKRKKRKSAKKNKMNISSLIITISMAFVLAIIVFAGIFYNMFKDDIFNRNVEVPSLTNLSISDARTKLQDVGLELSISNEKYSDEVAKGHIISQDYEKGEILKEGFSLNVVVSKGMQLSEVPNVLQKNLDEASLIIENESLLTGAIEYDFSDLPKGYVISQSPQAGESVKIESKVDLVISQGPEIKSVIMPNIKGKTLDKVREMLEPLNIRIGNVDFAQSTNYEENLVMSQSVASGREVDEGITVNVTISTGNPNSEVTEDENSDDSSDDSSETTDTNDENLVETFYVVPLEFDQEKETVKVEVVKNGESRVVYKKEHQKSEKNVRISVKAIGRVTINFYYGDKLVNSVSEDF